MKLPILISLAALVLSPMTEAIVVIDAVRVNSSEWNYSVSNFGPASSTDRPCYFSVPFGDGLSIDEARLSTPPGFQVYGQRDNDVATEDGEIMTLAFAADMNSNILQMPQPGASLNGFHLAFTSPTVLETTELLYGIGDFTTDEIIYHGKTLGPMPVAGTVQATGQVSLSNYVGSPGMMRTGFLIFTPILGGAEHFTTASVDERELLLCAGPEESGQYQLLISFPGYLARVVNVQVSNGTCQFATVLTAGDIDNSNEVDAADIDAVIADFGETLGDADCDGSGEVDAADIDIVIGNFGQVGD